ncbi:MAG: UDP-N-acetylmuramoyl-tripeptide--D-alanyl-D-alanine ligase [Candidatus Omnitrophota bacterium]
MAKFTLQEIIKCTKGKLLSGRGKAIFFGISTDSRTLKTGELFLAIKGNKFDGHNFIKYALKQGAGGIIIQDKSRLPSTLGDLPVILVEDTTKAFGDIAHYHRMKFRIPVIAITGSNGKTTTKDMIAALLKKRYRVLKSIGTENNNIGVPKALLGISKQTGVAVLELGTNHFGEMKNLADITRPTVCVITNIGPTHLEYLKTTTGVFREKISLLKSLGPRGSALLNADDDYLSRVKNVNCSVIRFGRKPGSRFRATDIIFDNCGFNFTLNSKLRFRVNLLGEYNLYNALAAISVARLLRVSYSLIKKALSEFKAPAMRMEVIKLNGVEIINDAYNSNPQSLKEAIRWLGSRNTSGRKFLIAGDMLELGKDRRAYHRKSGELAARHNIDYVISYGELARLITMGAVEAGLKKDRVFSFTGQKGASRIASILKNMLKPRDVVLIKGSRAMKMEELIKCFTTSCTR